MQEASLVLPFICTIVLLVYMSKEYSLRRKKAFCFCRTKRFPRLRLPYWCWILTPFVLVGLWLTGLEWLFWIFSSAYLFAAAPSFSSNSSFSLEPGPRITSLELIGLACICGIVVLITLGAHRPDADDAFFVSLATAAIDNPGEPLYGFDNLYRSRLPLVEQHLHFLQTYEYFVAVLADYTKIPVRVLYYIVLPAFWAPVGILVHWILLRRFLPSIPTLVASIATVIILVSWGDGHRTYGNFAFVRMFQGKAVYLLVALPMIVHSALEYFRKPTSRNWLFLMLHQCAAMGFTTNGLVVAPLTASLVLLSKMQFSRLFWRRAIVGLTTSFPLFLLGMSMVYHLHQYQSPEQIEQILLGYKTVFGSHRTSLVLLGLLILPALSRMAKLRESSWLCSYVFLSSVLLLCPATSKMLGFKVAPVFSWRIFWIWPVPLLLGLSIGALACKSLSRPWLRCFLFGIFMMLFALVGPSTVDRGNWGWKNIGAFKVTSDYGIAQHLMTLAPKNGLALVPESLAVNLCGFHNAPPLIAVRMLYLRKLRDTIPKEDLAERIKLLSYIGGKTDDLTSNWAIRAIDRRDITTVAFQSTHPDADSLVESLEQRSFSVIRYEDYWLAVIIRQKSRRLGSNDKLF